jgi:hypothetical protein
MGKEEEKRPVVKLNEFLTKQELALSDFKGIDFKGQTAAVVEILTQEKPNATNIKKFLSDNSIDSSNKHWPVAQGIENLPIDKVFTRAPSPLNNSSLKSCKTELLASWREDETPNLLHQLWCSANEIETVESYSTSLFFSMHSAHRDCLKRIVPPVESTDSVTLTVLIPSVHNRKATVKSSTPKWTFHHTEFDGDKGLALRLFMVLECLNIETTVGRGVWYRLISALGLSVDFSNGSDVDDKWHTLFKQKGNDLYPLFKGNKQNDIKFKNRMYYSPEVLSSNSETKPSGSQYQLITGMNQLMMFTSGTAISIKIPMKEKKKWHRTPIIIAPKQWVEALSESLKTPLPDLDSTYTENLPVEHSFLFNENYSLSDEWRRSHSDWIYQTGNEKKDYNDYMEKRKPGQSAASFIEEQRKKGEAVPQSFSKSLTRLNNSMKK